MKKEKIVVGIIVLCLCYVLGFVYLKDRDFVGIDCKKITTSYWSEENCLVHQGEKYNKGFYYSIDGIKFLLSPIWVIPRGLGELIN